MACPFDITIATNSIRLNAKRQGEAAFTVFNRSGRPVRGRAQVAAQPPEAAAWLGVAGEAERNFAIAGTEQITVQVTVPAQAAPGTYTLRLDMVGVENPDEDYCSGPSVTLVVPAPEPAKPFPWWIVVAAAVALAIGVGAFIFWPRQVAVPSLSGLAVNDARATLTALGLVGGSVTEGDGGGVAVGLVIASTPAPETSVARGAVVDLVIAAAPTPTPTPEPTPTDTPVPTPTLDATATAQAQATLAAQATATAVAAAIDRYVGNWEVSEEGSPYITKLKVGRDGQSVTVSVVGLAYPAILSGGVGSVLCQGECTWGTASTAYVADPVQFSVNPSAGLTQRLTLTAVDGSTLSAVYQIRADNITFPNTVFLLKRSRGLVVVDDLLAPRAAEIIVAENFYPSLALTPVPVMTLVAPGLDIRANPRAIIIGD